MTSSDINLPSTTGSMSGFVGEISASIDEDSSVYNNGVNESLPSPPKSLLFSPSSQTQISSPNVGPSHEDTSQKASSITFIDERRKSWSQQLNLSEHDWMTSAQAQNVLQSQWLASQKQIINKKLIAAQQEKKRRKTDEKAAALQLERTLPMDLLALDWFSENNVNMDLRLYLVDRLMPTLVLGMEKVLQEAEKFGLLDGDFPDDDLGGDFSPINYLAQYLMRNNPRYSHLNKNSPYVRGLQKVSEEMKKEVLSLEENRLAQLKRDAQRKRESIEEREERKKEEAKERAKLLKLQFPHWLVDDGQLQLQLVQNALYSYLEISSHLASGTDNVIHYSRELDPTDETGKTLTINEYIEYLEEFVCEMTMPEFIQLLRHLDHCAAAFRRTFEREVWRDMFVKLFASLDSESCGYIDRHRMLHLLEKFWDKLEDDEKSRLHNPRKWPVIELEELDDLYPDTEEDSESDESVMLTSEEMGSSDWASMLLPDRGGSVEEVATGSTESGQGSSRVIVSKSEEEKSTSKESVSTFKEENRESVEKEGIASGAESVEVESTKVSSAAGLDAGEVLEGQEQAQVPAEETPQAPAEETTEAVPTPAEGDQEEELRDSKAESVGEKEGRESKTDEIVEEAQDAEQEHPSEQAEESPDVKEQTSVEGIERADIEDPQETTSSEKPQTEKPEEPEEGATMENAQTEEGKKEDPKPEKEKEGEDAKEQAAEPGASLTTSGANLAATLITPAPSTEESREVGPVNIQFSKEKLQPKVRKTTLVTTVQRASLPTEGAAAEATAEDNLQQVQGPAAERPDIGDTETIITTTAPTVSEVVPISETVLVQDTADDMSSYKPQPVEVKTRPGSTGRMSVTFAAEPLVLPDRPSAEFFSQYTSRSHSRMTSAFDENQLNEGRFISLLENFTSDETEHDLVEQLVNFIFGGYVETEEEKMARLEKARREILSAKHRQMVDNLFNKWDNDGQGFVDNEEVDGMLSKYKGGMELSAIKRGRQAVRAARKNAPYHDRRRLNRKEFHIYINSVCAAMAGGEEVFDGLVEFLTTTVERTYTERIRGEARRKWLDQILASAETGGSSMEMVYRAIFQTLRKDAEAHGNQKKMSAYVALLEHNLLYPNRGDVLLRYVACTPDNSPFMLGKAFYEDMQGISFYAVRRGKLVHVPRVQSHGRIYFWNPARVEGDREGSLVLVPIRDERRRTFGLLGIDNVDSAAATDRSIFASHEISFYQGVAKSFSTAFHHVDLRKKLLRIVDAAMSWVHSRAPRVRNIVVYFVEPDPKGQSGNVLRKMVTADNNTGLTITHSRPQRLYRKDNLFRDYLFKSMENSETTSADAYGERHTAYPLRDAEGRCQCVIDISIGKLKHLPKHENREVQRMLKLLQAANREVMKESIGGEKTVVLEAEEKGGDETRVDIMFDRLMLTDLRENVEKLDNNVFAELKNYKVPPPMIHNIVKAVILIYMQDLSGLPELDDWVTCKQMLTAKLRQWIVVYDPTSEQRLLVEGDEQRDELVQEVGKLLKGIPHGAVAKQGSRPTQQLYNWAFVCLSLMEHAKKMRQNEGQPAFTPVTSASTNTTQESHDVASEHY